jgi:hypothetical protein
MEDGQMTSHDGSHHGGPEGSYPAPDAWGSPTAGQNPAPYGGYPAQPQGTPYGPPMQQPAPYGPPYGPPYGQHYGQPYGYPYPPQQRTNGLAIASMVLGILWLYWIGSILALVFGYIARRQIRERGESGGGMATAGIVLGWIGVGFIVVAVVVGIAANA